MFSTRRYIAHIEAENARLQQRERDLLAAIFHQNNLPMLADRGAEPPSAATVGKPSRLARVMAWRKGTNA